jgi:hypothetical protein
MNDAVAKTSRKRIAFADDLLSFIEGGGVPLSDPVGPKSCFPLPTPWVDPRPPQ